MGVFLEYNFYCMYNMLYFTGVLIGALISRHGCRVIAVFGTFFASVGYFVSAFASSIPILYITLGLIPGKRSSKILN